LKAIFFIFLCFDGSSVLSAESLFSLADEITYKNAAAEHKGVTSSAILGPFWRKDTPVREFGSTIVLKAPEDGEIAWMTGVVEDAKTGKPIANALVDVWEASTNGTSTV
jgi:catechol 1,2-dioxygenase